jgi:hypothetical protein
MKKCVAVCVCVVASFGFADEMPLGSSQAVLTEVLARETLMTPYEPCPPAQNQRDIQVVCANYGERDPLDFMRRLDEVVYSFSVYPDIFPELAGVDLTPRTSYWVYLPEYGRYERSFELDGGSYRVIYVPLESLSSTITIVYTPHKRQA